jgi:KUP system potassium uptake protein
MDAATPPEATRESARPEARGSQPLRLTMLAALGVVFGDLGTSPLYTLQTVVQAMDGQVTRAGALGALSLIVWTLIITISIKYCLFVMRADNKGEGGILALMSLIGASGPGLKPFTVMALLGAALIYGDGVITPAISVLSALEGVNAATDAFKPYVMPAAVLILVALFASQRFGTERIGRAFGPVMLLWFAVIGLLGLISIVHHPGVLVALDPSHAVRFMMHSGGRGLLVLGGVFLCITGGEALYADMGHFGKRAVRSSWYFIALPALLLSYAGQTAFVMDNTAVKGNPFFLVAPAWSIYPMVLLATIATIIASQAIITGSFSMTRQAIQLGWLPGLAIRQTSDRVYGQIYVPVVNWLLMVASVSTTIAFGSSDRLASAYGTAVATTMLLTTVLLYQAMAEVWRWPRIVAVLTGGFFFIVDLSFFSANLLKIEEGGWLPLTLAALIFVVMTTWRKGMDAIHSELTQTPEEAERFLAKLKSGAILRTDGTTVFITRSNQRVSRLIVDHSRYLGVLPRRTVALSIRFETTPRIPEPKCTVVEQLADGVWLVVARFGFFEIPDLRAVLNRATGLDQPIDFDRARFVAARDLVVRKPRGSALSGWRIGLFAFLYRNAAKIVDRFNLPPQRVVEIARQIEI